MSDSPVGVVKALTAVMGALPAIGKGDKSPEGYQYRGIEAITKHLQPLLATHGVIIVPSAQITSVVPSPEMKPGWQDVYVTVDWSIYGPDGSSIVARTNGIGRDRADKGANKAQTQAFKYLLLHLLSIADKADDADGLTYEHERDESRRSVGTRSPRGAGSPQPAPSVNTDRMVELLEVNELNTKDDRLAYCGKVVGRELTSARDLTQSEVDLIITKLEAMAVER